MSGNWYLYGTMVAPNMVWGMASGECMVVWQVVCQVYGKWYDTWYAKWCALSVWQVVWQVVCLECMASGVS